MPGGNSTRDINPSSSRFLATVGDTTYYLGLPRENSGREACLVVEFGGQTASGRRGYLEGGSGPGLKTAAGRAMLVPQGFDTLDLVGQGWEAVHPDLLVRW